MRAAYAGGGQLQIPFSPYLHPVGQSSGADHLRVLSWCASMSLNHWFPNYSSFCHNSTAAVRTTRSATPRSIGKRIKSASPGVTIHQLFAGVFRKCARSNSTSIALVAALATHTRVVHSIKLPCPSSPFAALRTPGTPHDPSSENHQDPERDTRPGNGFKRHWHSLLRP